MAYRTQLRLFLGPPRRASGELDRTILFVASADDSRSPIRGRCKSANARRSKR